ncbi:MAG: tRNA (adenosine(37)-N6)-threonylcarbamoyltransferase complex transferase subunit TsaD [Bacteroidota bacterium]
MTKTSIIIGIESSCDDTAAAVIKDGKLLANIVSTQNIHKAYGGVVPELASRAHQQNIIPVIDQALKQAGVTREELSAVAFTRGPGLMGSLLVGTSFAKGFALGLNIPLIEVNHMQGHILAHFIKTNDEEEEKSPSFPFICLTVSGGHTQIVLVKDIFDMEIIGETIDDAAGEAFDKAAKIMGLPYPGGPLIDKYAKEGNPRAFTFSKPKVSDLNYSFSGLKTGFMNFINNETAKNPDFVELHKADICASIQYTIIDILVNKLKIAAEQNSITQIALAGGVSANSGLRATLKELAAQLGWQVFIPKFEYCTDNAAMIAVTGYYKFLKQDFTTQGIAPLPRYVLGSNE